MTLTFDLFFSFRSPYSYLAVQRLGDEVARYDMACRLCPVHPLAVRVKDFFKNVNPLWPGYLLHDLPRLAEMQGVPIAWPRPDPIVQDATTLEVAAEQPYIARLTRLGVAADEAGGGLAYAREVSRVIWGGTTGWDEGDHLKDAAARAGLDFAALERTAADEAARIDAVIAANEAAQTEAGHWGVPLMVFEGEPFFGQDRIDLMLWRMKGKGLKVRD